MNKQEEQRQFARDLCACYVDQSFGWDEDSIIDAIETSKKLNKMGYRLEKNVVHDICRFLASNQKVYEQKNEYEKAAVVWSLLRLIVKKYDITDWEDLI